PGCWCRRCCGSAIDEPRQFIDAHWLAATGIGSMAQYHFKNFEMLDPERDELAGGYELLVEGELIKEVSAKTIKATGATPIDCGKRTLMPGLIDSHVHVVLSEGLLPRLENVPLTLMTARAAGWR